MSDELGFNKIAGAVLATALAFIGVKEIAHAAYHPHTPEVPAYGADILAAAEAAANAGAVEEIILPFPQQDWLDAMSFDAGELVSLKCVACHSFTKGGPAVSGPNLYGIVGSAAAQRDGFKYSAAMTESGIVWDFETLNAYLEKPSRYVKGTNMTFAGLKKPAQRAAMIEYLRTFADSPVPQPAVAVMAEVETTVEGMIETVEGEMPAVTLETLVPGSEGAHAHDATTEAHGHDEHADEEPAHNDGH